MEPPLPLRPADYAAQNEELARLITCAQAGSVDCVEEMLLRFRPLLRARMHWLWQSVREEFSSLEWGDIEAQVHELFLMRLQKFRLEEGVFFPHYISRLLDLDSRDWLRRQRRAQATPFSQLYDGSEFDDASFSGFAEGGAQPRAAALDPSEADRSSRVDDVVSLREALQVLSAAQREVIECCYARGLTEAQAAIELGISRSAVRNRLHGAIERLRAFFGADGSLAGAQVGTRTGRASSALSEPLNFVFWRMEMAKDDRRPDLVGVGSGRPILMQGVFDFPATGLKTPQLLSPRLRYIVPQGSVAGIRFMRVGVTCDALVCVSTVVNGMPHRLVPVAPNSAVHIPFAIVEPIVAGSEIEIHVASDKPGTAVIDMGCLEMPS